jgi:hypothetical protein
MKSKSPKTSILEKKPYMNIETQKLTKQFVKTKGGSTIVLYHTRLNCFQEHMGFSNVFLFIEDQNFMKENVGSSGILCFSK